MSFREYIKDELNEVKIKEMNTEEITNKVSQLLKKEGMNFNNDALKQIIISSEEILNKKFGNKSLTKDLALKIANDEI